MSSWDNAIVESAHWGATHRLEDNRTVPQQRSTPSDCTSKSPAGVALPIIDRNRCEGKEDCVVVCPYDVFEVRKLTEQEREGMSLLGSLKYLAHGRRQAVVAKPMDCHACGLCVQACPEKAITLRRNEHDGQMS
ncbi:MULTISPECIES: ferredoxin family protein [unclassified Frankia]|uniref:4Fe-4S dicluster domain-containing protein n=1 Tax=unclassified Frankia TaxID=2632575 RepID=UPI002AD24E02|nr:MULTISPECIES: ferredoxin family protein [unclassified Frankia]